MAAQQLELQVVERVEAGEAVRNAARRRGVGLQPLGLAGDPLQRVAHTMPLDAQRGQDARRRRPAFVRTDRKALPAAQAMRAPELRGAGGEGAR